MPKGKNAKRKNVTKAEVEEEMLRIMDILNLTDTLPRSRDVRKHGTISEVELKKYGSMKGISKMMGIPTYRETPTDKEIVEKIKHIMNALQIDYMPSYNQIYAFSEEVADKMKTQGGRKRYAEIMGITDKKPKTKRVEIKRSETVEVDICKSTAFKKEKELRKIGKSYADYQKEQTLALVGKIDISKYEGMK